MAKKETAREKREREERERKARYQKENLERERELSARKEEERKRKEEGDGKAPAPSPAGRKTRKSAAKANGLKSILVLEDRCQMTSFGRGNEAVLEKEVVRGELRDINQEKPNFDAAPLEACFEIKRRGANLKPGYVDRELAVREDLIGAKAELEKRYFGQPMKGNVHIQVVYNILDMEKILARYIDNILYALANVLKVPGKDPEDQIGNLGSRSYADFMYEKEDGKPKQDENGEYIKNREHADLIESLYKSAKLRFFGSAFYDTGFDAKAPKTRTVKNEKGESVKKETAKKRSKEDFYYILSLLGGIRQFTKHGRERGKDRTWLYSLDRVLNADEKSLLDRLYGEHIEALNQNFVRMSAKDLTVAAKVLDAVTKEEKTAVVEEYYRFIVRKDARNIGFSVKKLRECLVENHLRILRQREYDPVRSKLYRLFDFVIFEYYRSPAGEGDVAAFVDTLRTSLTAEEKEKAYGEQAERLWQLQGKKLSAVAKELGNGNEVGELEEDKDLRGISLKRVEIPAGGTSYFSKLVYLMTLFLDGKEINGLLTSLINKLEDIQSFYDIMQKDGLPLFLEGKGKAYDYAFFKDGGRIADEIRVVKSIARMEAPTPAAKESMYIDALNVLGIEDEAQAGEFFKDDKKVRNFVANNVIESARFQYLVRYADIRRARAAAKCRPLVGFVLNQIPDSQLDRYMAACGQDTEVLDKGTKVRKLSDLVYNYDITKELSSLKNNKQVATAVLGLYLTFLYLVHKNLVNVNSIYTMAIHALERDTELLAGRSIFDKKEGENYDALFAMTDRYIERQTEYIKGREAENERIRLENDKIRGGEGAPAKHIRPKRINKRALKCVIASKNAITARGKEADPALDKAAHFHICRLYRNAIAHLSVVTNAYRYFGDIGEKDITSYFALYHYLMQRYLADAVRRLEKQDDAAAQEMARAILGSRVAEWMANVEEYHGYSKDWLWSLNSPFAYNQPRYKCLSVEELFSRDEGAVVKTKETEG